VPLGTIAERIGVPKIGRGLQRVWLGRKSPDTVMFANETSSGRTLMATFDSVVDDDDDTHLFIGPLRPGRHELLFDHVDVDDAVSENKQHSHTARTLTGPWDPNGTLMYVDSTTAACEQ
jgi:hypothetical protein